MMDYVPKFTPKKLQVWMDHKAYSAIHQAAGSLVTGSFVLERLSERLGVNGP